MNLLNKICIVPLAEESFGVRSMATFIETPDLKILLDAGVSLAPRRYGLPPHPLEFQAVKSARERILKYAREADIIVVSHYHYDHYTPAFSSWYEWTSEETYKLIYEGKTVLAKNWTENINFNQRKRAHAFLKSLEGLNVKVEAADGKKFWMGRTVIEFSEPLPHGPDDTKLGWVLCIAVRYGYEKVVYAPDVQGPISAKALEAILSLKPSLALIGGPPLYLEGRKVKKEHVDKGFEHLLELAKKVRFLVVGHHMLRDLNWRERAEVVLKEASSRKHLFLTPSQLLGQEPSLLEAKRKRLYEERPPSKDFMKWLEELKAKKALNPPPLL